jgi:hypothetical protein
MGASIISAANDLAQVARAVSRARALSHLLRDPYVGDGAPLIGQRRPAESVGKICEKGTRVQQASNESPCRQPAMGAVGLSAALTALNGFADGSTNSTSSLETIRESGKEQSELVR